MKPETETDARVTDTRKKILDLAQSLMLSRGFNAFSYQHISAELGVRNAAIHYHFPKKTDLGVALIERYCRRFERFVAAQSGLTPVQQLAQYFELADRYFLQQQICPSGILSAELQTLPEEMQQQTRRFVGLMRAWAVDIVRRGREQALMHYPGSDAGMGDIVFAAMQGALQLARFDQQALPAVKQQISLLLGCTQDQ